MTLPHKGIIAHHRCASIQQRKVLIEVEYATMNSLVEVAVAVLQLSRSCDEGRDHAANGHQSRHGSGMMWVLHNKINEFDEETRVPQFTPASCETIKGSKM
jgi:hypothetical protein